MEKYFVNMLVNLEHPGVLSYSGERGERQIPVKKGWVSLRERSTPYFLNGSKIYPLDIPEIIGHRGLGQGEARRENRVETIQRAALFCRMAEVDVQVTEDGVCILYHDSLMDGRKVDQWKHRDLPQEADTLRDLLNNTSIGLNIEIKYEEQPKHSVAEWCSYIMKEILSTEEGPEKKKRSPEDTSDQKADQLKQEKPAREMIFSSFSREVCVELKAYTEKIFFLMEYLTEEGISFARENEFIGIVTEAKEVLEKPHLISEARKASLLLLTYGDRNNCLSGISLQRLLGVDGMISDEVESLSEFL